MRIIGPHTAFFGDVENKLTLMPNMHPRFISEIFPALWNAAENYTVDGVGMVAQAIKETGRGNFTGQVKPEFYNTAGIKVRHNNLYPGITDGDNPLAHQMFPNWAVGAMAHGQHLRAYAGWPVDDLIVDPRYTYALKTARNGLTHFNELGGKWAPSATYGQEIESLMKALQPG